MMISIGFVSAILGDKTLEEVIDIAAKHRFGCVELMCWPVGKAERRYAGVTHVDVDALTPARVKEIKKLTASKGVSISGLGYYPNTLDEDTEKRKFYAAHLKKVIDGAAALGVPVVNTFIGRIPSKDLEYNFRLFEKVWPPVIRHAEGKGVKVAIENCPMYFTGDEWPAGKNLAYCPAIFRRMFASIPSKHFGLNFDPSHFVWQHMDYLKPLKEFKERLFHIHIKDAKVEKERLDDVGILATPLQYHSPRLPGMGDVDWGRFMSTLYEVGYRGPACVEVEDRNYEGGPDDVLAALVQSRAYMSQFIP
jgi:sugar phosphate isomerase/epimerase